MILNEFLFIPELPYNKTVLANFQKFITQISFYLDDKKRTTFR